jgi:plastocyanin
MRHVLKGNEKPSVIIDRIVQECRHGALAMALFVGIVAPPGVRPQATGSISGVITTKAAALKPMRVTFDQRVCGNELPDETIAVGPNGQLANAVVTLVGVKSRVAPAAGTVMNERCRFTPRVQVARPGTTITTSSTDPVLHTTNAAMENGKGLFNVAVPVPGIRIAKPLNGPGLVRISCNTHPWMRGYIMVTDDVAAVTDANGSFTLTDVPPGTYELRVWHETLKAASRKVTVEAGKSAIVNLEI